MLSESQAQRYSRQVLLPEIGDAGQRALLMACVRVPELNVAGRAAAMWVARAGVGRIVLADDQTPAPANDPAGLLHAEDAGRPLAEVVRLRLRFHSPDVVFDGVPNEAIPAGTTVAEGIQAAITVLRRLLE